MIAKRLEEATLSDSGHTIDPNTHNLSISINHHIPCNNNDLSTFVHEIKMKINYAFFKENNWMSLNWELSRKPVFVSDAKTKNAFAT